MESIQKTLGIAINLGVRLINGNFKYYFCIYNLYFIYFILRAFKISILILTYTFFFTFIQLSYFKTSILIMVLLKVY